MDKIKLGTKPCPYVVYDDGVCNLNSEQTQGCIDEGYCGLKEEIETEMKHEN